MSVQSYEDLEITTGPVDVSDHIRGDDTTTVDRDSYFAASYRLPAAAQPTSIAFSAAELAAASIEASHRPLGGLVALQAAMRAEAEQAVTAVQPTTPQHPMEWQ